MISTSLETHGEGAQAALNYTILKNKDISIVESWHSHPNVTDIKNFIPSGFYANGATSNSGGDRIYFDNLKYKLGFGLNQTPSNLAFLARNRLTFEVRFVFNPV